MALAVRVPVEGIDPTKQVKTRQTQEYVHARPITPLGVRG